MFELLLIIYLLPVLIIGMLLLKLVFWLLRISIRRYAAPEAGILAFEDFHTSGCMAG